MTKNIKTGKDSVVIGDVSGEVGDGSVVIGPTDSRGNTIINQPMAVGRGAKAGPSSIAIGAGAAAGSDVLHLFQLLLSTPEVQNDETLLSTVQALTSEIQKPEPKQSLIKALWQSIEMAVTSNEAVGLIGEIGAQLGF